MTWKTTNTAKGDNKLYSDAKGVVPSLDLRFAESKTLNDYMTGQQLIAFSRPVGADQSPGTYVDENGIIQLSSADQPRFDHNPTTGESLGLLIEESRTNYVNNSTTLSLATLNGGTGVAPQVGTVTTVGPDGVSASITRSQLDRGTGNTSNDYSLVGFTPTTPSANYSQSIWLKSNDTNNYIILMYDAGGGKGNEFTVTPEWQRFTLDASTSYKNSGDAATTSPSLIVGLRNGPNSTNYYTGTTNSQTADILLWGPQIENGTFVTSYIPTDGTTVTRAADVSTSALGVDSFYNQSEGTIFAECSINANPAGNAYVFNLRGSIASHNRIAAYINSSNRAGWIVTTNVVLQAGGNYSDHLVPNGGKFIIGYKLNDFAFDTSSGPIKTDSSGTPSSSINALTIAALGSSSSLLNGHISRLAYFPTRLPDATLQNITN